MAVYFKENREERKTTSIMAPKEKHIFEISGPKHLAGLPSIDW
jgi:hypothetical protein